MTEGEVAVNGAWRRWPDPKAGPWTVSLTFVEVDGRPEVVGMHLWHGVLPSPLPDPPVKWTAASGLPGPRAIQATSLRELRIGELVDVELATMRATAARHLQDPEATVHLLGEANAEWALTLAKFLVPSPKSVGRPRKWGPEHFAEVAAVYEAAPDRRRPTMAVRSHFNVSPALAAKWVRECRNLGLLPETTPGKSTAGRTKEILDGK